MRHICFQKASKFKSLELKNSFLYKGVYYVGMSKMQQRIAWSMPTYGEKEIVVQYSACKNHASLYVGEKAIEHFSADLRGYEFKKSAVYLQYSQPLPEALIAKIVKWCYEN